MTVAIPQKLGQIQWGDLVMGPGTGYSISSLSGIDDLPEVRNQDVAKTDAHGDYTGPDYTGPRTVQIGLTLVADTPDQLRTLTLALRRATQPQLRPDDLQLLDWGVSLSAKIRKRAMPYDAENLWSSGSAVLEFYCADPYLYGLAEQSASTVAYSPSSGRTYPLGYSAVVPTTNLLLNPSTTDTTGSVTYDPSTTGNITRTVDSTFWHRSGSTSAQVTMGGAVTITGGWSYDLATSQAAATVVTGSAYVFVPSGSGITDLAIIWRNGTAKIGESHFTPVSGEQRISAAFTVPAGQTLTRMAIAATGPGGSVFYIDAAQVEPGSTLTPYTDGDSGGVWQGAPSASASVRPAGTARTYGSTGASGGVTATNDGDAPAYPVLRIDGPVATPSVEQTNVGALLVLDATLQAGDYVLIDTRSRAVLYQGTTPRRAWVRGGSTWPLLVPGDNQLTYRGSALPGSPGQTSLLTVTWRDTSL
jgi:hypothetical protein